MDRSWKENAERPPKAVVPNLFPIAEHF
jgi:hypothetical protein